MDATESARRAAELAAEAREALGKGDFGEGGTADKARAIWLSLDSAVDALAALAREAGRGRA